MRTSKESMSTLIEFDNLSAPQRDYMFTVEKSERADLLRISHVPENIRVCLTA